MEHKNLFLFGSAADMEAAYPDGKVDTPVPGVAYAKAGAGVRGDVYYNKKVTTYTITLHYRDANEVELSADETVQTGPVVEGETVNIIITPKTIAGYESVTAGGKVGFDSDSDYTVYYEPAN